MQKARYIKQFSLKCFLLIIINFVVFRVTLAIFVFFVFALVFLLLEVLLLLEKEHSDLFFGQFGHVSIVVFFVALALVFIGIFFFILILLSLFILILLLTLILLFLFLLPIIFFLLFIILILMLLNGLMFLLLLLLFFLLSYLLLLLILLLLILSSLFHKIALINLSPSWEVSSRQIQPIIVLSTQQESFLLLSQVLIRVQIMLSQSINNLLQDLNLFQVVNESLRDLFN